MATMYPRRLNPADGHTTSEAKVFDALRDGLPDDWHVFHSVAWVARDAATGGRDGEIDFVLAHAEEGVLCLEVKGSGIECRYGEWYRVERDGTKETIADPFWQALQHRYALQRKIDDVQGWHGRELFIGHCVCFPQVTIHRLALAPDAPRELLIDRAELRAVEPSIERVLAYHRGARDKRRAPGDDGIAMLRELLAPQLSIPIRLVDEFADEEEQLVLLTAEQSTVMNRYARAKRMVITGCAGSGKTMLAVERARRLARAGESVLFVCFNKALRAYLAERHPIKGVDYFTFHGVCTRLAGAAGIKLPKFKKGEDPPPEYFEDELPLALIEATEQSGGRYDAILVDEAQDLHNHWLEALMTTLRDEDAGSVWLFMDDNQRVYDAVLDVPKEFTPFDLPLNCRNTQAIHREVVKLYRGAVTPSAIGPEGRQPEVMAAKDQARAVASVLEYLCVQEGVPPQDVVVLSSHGAKGSKVYRNMHGRFEWTDKFGELGDKVFFSSIRAFKGLESPVVVLCEAEDLDDMSREQQLYVGISRAKNHCVVVTPG
jgi:Nuclease-related domain/AAA domain/UvrD-like helicase C-terminal domain